jgi:hypothetical protein
MMRSYYYEQSSFTQILIQIHPIIIHPKQYINEMKYDYTYNPRKPRIYLGSQAGNDMVVDRAF